LNVVTGDGSTGQALAESAEVDVLSFTGSTATGRKVIEASKGNIKKVSLELGGKAASIVFADADIADAADGVTFGAFFNNGECCVAQSRLLVQSGIADEFLQEVRKRAEVLEVGQPLAATTDVGAVIHEKHMESVLSSITDAQAAGAAALVGGRRAGGRNLDSGWFVEPTILDHVSRDMAAFQKEIFGPVLSVTRFESVSEAVSLANGVDYGLANTIWSSGLDTVLQVSRRLKSGTVYVNTSIDGPPVMPFGGYKASGVGREMGEAGFEEFTELKSVNIRTGRRLGAFALGGLRESS
jgi:acyl-CoA reductase-like NAD-dependent aldehyde dehydrogenase